MSRAPIPPVERLLGQGTAPAVIATPGHGNDPTDAPARVAVAGTADHAPGPVHIALTRAWVEIGRPIVVVHGGHPTGTDAHAAAWAHLHQVCGITDHTEPDADARVAGAALVIVFPGDRRNDGTEVGRVANAALDAQVDLEIAPAEDTR